MELYFIVAFKLFSKKSILFPQETKQQKLMVALAGLVLATLTILYFGFFRSPSVPSPSEEPGPSERPTSRPAEVIKKIEFDIGFLKEPNFRALKIYGEWPIKVEEKGRENPFLPY